MHRHGIPARTRTVRSAVTAVTIAAGVLTVVATATAARATTAAPVWTPVATSADTIPGTTVAFNSFNAPAVNSAGQVVFRARSKGGTAGEPVHGVWTRAMGTAGSAIRTVATKATPVPYTNTGATFTEFPSSPRIAQDAATIVTRGQSTPTFTYTDVNGSDTRVGTSGVYVDSGGTLSAGANLLGAVPTTAFPDAALYSVPGVPGAPIRFDQFPGSPSVTGTTVVFKGNYTAGGVSGTGVFYRAVTGGGDRTHLIANSATPLPDGSGVPFGSTAPPSASGGSAVFVGWDNEAAPTRGGVYLAPLTDPSPLRTLVRIGDQVPGEPAGTPFTNFGESLSYNGRYVAFWGSWGTATATTVGICPNDGNKDRLAYCLAHDNNATLTYPVHQGVFVEDTLTGALTRVASTGDGFGNFLFWAYTGHVPGVGGTDEQSQEPPAWRASSYVALSGDGRGFQVAFQATRSTGERGIYLVSPESGITTPTALVETGMPAAQVDPRAPGAVSALGLERDGFRDGWLAIGVSTFDAATGASWAGVYTARLTVPIDTTVTAPAVGALYAVGAPVTVTASFTDTDPQARHSCLVDWGSGAATAGVVTEAGGTGTCTATRSYPAAGVYGVQVTVTDGGDGLGSAATAVVVYDPNAGFVTGGGWIDSGPGAYRPQPGLEGIATFGFVSRYQKGTTVPGGATRFRFEAAGLSFTSSAYQWLVVSGPLAQYKGTGTVSGLGEQLDGTYEFLLTARDGALVGGGGADTFRIKIFRDGSTLYDNGASPLEGGSIVIHRG